MKSKLFILFLLLLPVIAFCQNERKLLRGQLIADSIEVENVTVLNMTSNIKAISDNYGFFTIYAKPSDTLHFSSITFRPAMMVLKKEHFEAERLEIKLEINVTVLDEVIIIPLTGDLARDSNKKKTQEITGGLNSGDIIKNSYPKPKEQVNKALYQESQLQGVDFRKIYRMIFGYAKKKDTGEQYLEGKTFGGVVKERYSHHFFTETLKIPHDQIGLFLNYCDKGTESYLLLNPQKEFELTDYLVVKAAEYKAEVKEK